MKKAFAVTDLKMCAIEEQVNARTTGQRKTGMRWVLGLRICGTAGAESWTRSWQGWKAELGVSYLRSRFVFVLGATMTPE